MYCPNCGQYCADGMKFCEHCGATLQDPMQQAAQQPVQNPVQQPYYNPAPVVGPVLDTVKKLMTSPLYLTAAIAYSCEILFSVALAVAGAGGWLDLLEYYLGWGMRRAGYSSWELSYLMDEINDAVPFLRGVTLGSALVEQIPSILMAVGIWLVFASAMDKSGGPMKTTGMTITKVITMIGLIGKILLLFIVEGVIIFVIAAASHYDDSIIGIGIFIIILVLLAMGLSILMNVKILETVGTMQKTIQMGQLSDKVSAYVAVMLIISGIGSAINILGFKHIFVILHNLSGVVASIGFAVFIFQYRNKMRVLMAGGVPYPANAAQPVYQAQPMQQPVYAAQNPTPAEPAYSAPQAPAEMPPMVSYPVMKETPAPSMVVPETTVLNAKPAPATLTLTRARDGGSFTVSRPQFRIGRDPAAMDYIVSDNTAVGRHHADILWHDDAYFVVDMNSTNHTYLNGQEIAPGMEYMLQNGDELTLGDEVFHVSVM